jgi:hypothetical protein
MMDLNELPLSQQLRRRRVLSVCGDRDAQAVLALMSASRERLPFAANGVEVFLAIVR